MRSLGYLIAILMISQSNMHPLVCIVLMALVILLQIYDLFKNNPGCKIFLIFRYIPKYKKLISQYDAKYPCVMESVSTRDTSFHNLKGIYDLKSYIFIKDASFVIISTANPDIYIEIPFKSIIYHDSYCAGRNSGENYYYRFELFFKLNNDIERLWIFTLEYNHKLCKKYPDLLCDDQLFNFICENFPDEEEYRRQRDLERRRSYDDFFETSIFHKFTTIDAE